MSKTVCVTGGSGLIAGHVILQLLEAKYIVRTTVRDLKNDKKWAHLKKMPNADTNLSFFEADLLKEGSFDTAFAGCVGVFHVASPVVGAPKDPIKELLEPALQGTLNVLRSCERAKTVKKVVVTSSIAALYNESEKPDPTVYNESHWNEQSSLSDNPYNYAKTQAEKAAWKFVEELKKTNPNAFDLVTVLPGFSFGPQLGSEISSSNQVVQYLLRGAFPANPRLSFSAVDLRDVARAHVLAYENPKAKGRYMVVNGTIWCQEIAAILRKNFPEYPVPSGKLPDFVMYLAALFDRNMSWGWLRSHLGKSYNFDSTKVKKELGLQLRPIEESITDAATSMVKGGLIQKKSKLRTLTMLGAAAAVAYGAYYWFYRSSS